jgi:phosphatidylglycerophosphate synthase
LGITPNKVTVTGVLLSIGAALLFWQGRFGAGLIAIWTMTFLDTVDGKLARVTVQSSRVGHFIDHGVDIIQPPILYILWGIALPQLHTIGRLDGAEWYWVIVGGYAGGRLAEAAFHALGDCSLFTWRPFDAYFRLITARRNPCLTILTAGWLLGEPGWGFTGVAAWTALTTAVLLTRLLQGAYTRLTGGPLRSWLHDRAAAAARHPLAYATFAGTRAAYGRADGPGA